MLRACSYSRDQSGQLGAIRGKKATVAKKPLKLGQQRVEAIARKPEGPIVQSLISKQGYWAMKKILTAIVLITSAGTASAADVPMEAPYTRALYSTSPVYSWTGFYIGAMGGYGWSDTVRASIGGLAVSASSSDLKGGFAGGTVGYNYQMGSWVEGIEVDAAWSDLKYSQSAFGVTLADKIQSFGSVTGRIGFVPASTVLVYFKGGYAWADNQISATGFGATFAESRFHSGGTVGVGFEYMFLPNWSGKVEYMWTDFGNASYLTSFVPGGVGLGASVNTVKAGINYHFFGPAVARY
jgi:outer membrane immunogenic protein